ncbi:MAG: hypothetical protein AAGB51_11755 [Planctomycetota bacterium]
MSRTPASKSDRGPLGGVVHTYLGYNPAKFPSPTTPPPDLASAAFEHMLRTGSSRELTPEDLANAIEIDPSQIAGLGPSIDALIESLEERKRRILATYETRSVLAQARGSFDEAARRARPPKKYRDAFHSAVSRKQVYLLERLWFALRDDQSSFGDELMRTLNRLGELYEVEALDGAYEFTGTEPMTVPQALEIKEELEAIDKLLEQLREALKTAKIGIVDLDELRRFVSDADADQLRGMQDRVREYLERMAEDQGIDMSGGSVGLGPKAMAVYQGALLRTIFGDLDAARSGRHEGPISGEGVVELAKTRSYTFGDSPTHLDVPQSLLNTAARQTGEGERPDRLRPRPDDLVIHETRNNPKCATTVLIDMSGSMRHGGQYVHCKRMAIALDGLIRREYPGDYLRCFEMATTCRPKPVSELPRLMPMPVTIRDPVVRMRADLSDPEISDLSLPPHFTNIQHGLSLSRRVLGAQDTPNRQVLIITDGLPTAHFEGEQLYMLYPPDMLTERATMREAQACARDGITINIFLLPSWSQDEDDIAFAHRLAETTKGRVFFTGGADVDRFVLWDYVNNRRTLIG